MFFEVDADSIDIKQLLQKDFLELSMRVISDANPNVNGSWFTVESMQKSIPNFSNKPILGYFENGDFVSHDGEWNYDTETQMNYWDTLGKKGERILGLIRESDPVEIVQGKDGLNWIELKCCLWVNYGFKQVKRLLKDAKKAKKNGGLAKNVSVEVDITDYEKLPNGVLKINDFNLIGITILGSRNGVKVEPGIENAGLSVIDIMGTEVFEAQKKAIRLAYEKIDNPNTKKEEVSKMENESMVQENGSKVEVQATEKTEQFSENNDNPAVNTEENSEGTNTEETQTFEDENKEEVCPECGKNPCECEKEHCKSDSDEDEGKTEDDDDKDDKEDNCKFEEAAENVECPSCASGTVYDLTYLLNAMSGFATNLAYTCNYYKEFEGDKEAIVATLERMKRQAAEDIAVVGGLVKDASEDLKKSIIAYEANISEDTISSLYKKYEEVKAQNAQFSAKIQEIEKSEFLSEAKNLLDLSKFDAEYTNTMYESCKSGEINSIDDLKNKLALKLFEETIKGNSLKVEQTVEEKTETEIATFEAPVNNPDTTSVFEGNANKSKKATPWEILKEYNKK